jgi:hypothetical protein
MNNFHYNQDPLYDAIEKILTGAVNDSDSVEEQQDVDMGTATIIAPNNKLHGKQVRIFYKFNDGRINVQYKKSNKKGDVLNFTLTKDQYKKD